MTELADIVTPLPPSWWPQTTAWLVLGLCLLAILCGVGLRAWRRWRANRYRRLAQAELARLRAAMQADAASRAAALLSMAALLKRTVLAVWPREAVAGLSGPAWRAFLLAHAGSAADAVPPLATLIEAEYRCAPADAAALAGWSAQQADAAMQACRRWIAGHRIVVPDAGRA